MDCLRELENRGYEINPNAKTIAIIQDKYLQKEHLHHMHGIPLPDYFLVDTLDAAKEAGLKFGYPFMLKNRKLAYDGKGNYVVQDAIEVEIAFDKLGGKDLYAEKWVPFVKELAVMVVRTKSGDVISYPVVETIQKNNICHIVIAPANISTSARKSAIDVAMRAINTLDGVGIFGIELFLLNDETVLLNEIAPRYMLECLALFLFISPNSIVRPHNSGHYTIEACDIDQFEMHLRAILGLPCPTPTMKVKAAIMINIIGTNGSLIDSKKFLQDALHIPGAGR